MQKVKASLSLDIGDRVAYTTPNGAYREERVMPADRLVRLPDDVSDEIAAAAMLKGMTVEYLLNRSYQVKLETTVFFMPQRVVSG